MTFLITTKNGKYIAVSDDKERAKIQFSSNYPSEKIRSIEEVTSGVFEVFKID